MTFYPKRDCGERFRIDAVHPGDGPDTIIDYINDSEVARETAKGVAQRHDVVKVVVIDRQTGGESRILKMEENDA